MEHRKDQYMREVCANDVSGGEELGYDMNVDADEDAGGDASATRTHHEQDMRMRGSDKPSNRQPHQV